MLSRCNTIIFVGILGSAALSIAPAGAHLEFIAAKSCGFELTYSRLSVYQPEVKGNGVAQCDGPPEEHILTLALEYLQGGTPPISPMPRSHRGRRITGPTR